MSKKQKKIRYINVVFDDNQRARVYTYKTTLKFEAGAVALVNVDGRHEIVTVVNTHVKKKDLNYHIHYKWIEGAFVQDKGQL